jgi:hypothetical protein
MTQRDTLHLFTDTNEVQDRADYISRVAILNTFKIEELDIHSPGHAIQGHKCSTGG